MVNRGDGGARRPAPPPGRPAPRSARPAADEDEEKTNAINLADMNLDDLDEAPMPAAPATRPAPRKPAARAPADEDEEKTSALNLAEIDLDALDAAPPARPQPAARPAPGRAAPAQPPARPPVARPQPTRPKPRSAALADEEEKTSALSLDDVERAMRQPSAPPGRPAPTPAAEVEEKTSAINLDEIDLDAVASSPARRGGTIPRPVSSKPVVPAPRPAPKKEPAEPVVEKTMAVSLDEFEARRPSASKPRSEAPKSADATFLVDEEEVPVVKAPPPKRLGASRAEEPAPAANVDAEPTLVVRAGPDAGKTFTLTKDLTLVGRGLDADVVINDASASRKHFNIVRTLSGWKLVDLGSGNGTRVDGTRVTEIALQNGMRIEAGGTTLEWAMASGSKAAASAAAEPAVRGPTGISPAMESTGARPVRRVAEDKPEIRRRDPSRLDRIDEKEELGRAKGGAAEEEVVEKTTFGDIQALEIDPEWEARRLKQRREGVADASAPEEEAEVEEASHGGGGSGVGKKLAIAGIIVGVLGGGFVAADKFAGLGIIFPKEVKVAKPDPEEDKTGEGKTGEGKTGEDKTGEDKTGEDKTGEDKTGEDKTGEDKAGEDKTANVDAGNPKEAAKKKVAEAEEAARKGRILAARELYLAALKLDDLVDGGDSGLVTVENAIKAFGKLNESVKAMGAQRWTDALTSATGIEEGAPNFELAQELAAIAEEGAVVEQLALAAELFAKKELDGAKAAVEKALEYARDKYPEGQGFKEAIARAAAPDADLTELDPSDPNADNPPKAQPSDLKPGLDAYAKGDFQGVVNAFDAIVYGGTASRADVAKAKAWSAAATIFDEAMKQVAANPDKPQEQLNYLRSARRADAIMGGAQQERLATELGKVYSVLARQSMDDKKVARAGLLARVALIFDPSAADAKAVQTEAAKEAKSWVAEAKGIDGDPDKAAEMFARALRVLPSDDPDYAEADKALGKLLASKEP